MTQINLDEVEMSKPHIILVSWPSFCQNYQNWWKFEEVLTKTILHSLRHGVLTKHPDEQRKSLQEYAYVPLSRNIRSG